MLGIDCLSAAKCFEIPVGVPRLVAAQNQICIATWIEGKQNAVGSPSMLDTQFLHVRKLGSTESTNVWPPEFRAIQLKHLNDSSYAGPFILKQATIPVDKLFADFNFPSHCLIIPSK